MKKRLMVCNCLLLFILAICLFGNKNVFAAKAPASLNIQSAKTLTLDKYQTFLGSTPVKFVLKSDSLIYFQHSSDSKVKTSWLQIYSKNGKQIKDVSVNCGTALWNCERLALCAGTYYMKPYYMFPKGQPSTAKVDTYKYKLKLKAVPLKNPKTISVVLGQDKYCPEFLGRVWETIYFMPQNTEKKVTYKIDLKQKSQLSVGCELYWLGADKISFKFYNASKTLLKTSSHTSDGDKFVSTISKCRPGTYYLEVTIKRGETAANKYAGKGYSFMISDPETTVEVGD